MADDRSAAKGMPNPTSTTEKRPSKAGGSSSRRRGKIDPTRVNGALVISDQAKEALETCELFRELDRHQVMAVAALVEEHSLNPNEILIGEGEPAQFLYIVIEGRGVAHVETDQGWMSLGLVGPGEAAGWSSLVDGQVYPATVKALTPMRVIRIETSGLTLLLNLEPNIGYPVHRSLSSIFYKQYNSALRALKTSG